MGETRITIRDKDKSWERPTGATHLFQLAKLHALVLEMEDVHFHFDSAVLLPDYGPTDADDDKSGNHITGLIVIRTAYEHAAAHPEQKLLSVGHTDRSGPAAYNMTLSERRSRNVRAVLIGDRDEWADLCVKQHVIKDYQLILKWVANVWYWPCDPGKVDGTAGTKTNTALHAFKARYNKECGGTLADTAAVDPPTWQAFFHMYMLGLQEMMETDEAGLAKSRAALKWLPPEHLGCGENHPITPDRAENYRSAIDRRVELLFFDPGEEPHLAKCHPSKTKCVPDECELYRKKLYVIKPIDVEPSATVSLQLTEITGLYQPVKPADKKDKLAQYVAGYKSADDQGRIFINQIPAPPSGPIDWEAIKKKNTQYIELTATVVVAKGTLPLNAKVLWEWSDPDDPSDTDMRDDAAAIVDGNDFDAGKRTGNQADDNQGVCDFPKVDAAIEPAYEEIAPYTLKVDAAPSHKCETLVVKGVSKVRFHCTNVGGDNYRIQATVKPTPRLVVTSGDKTGIMTSWKRIDAEYRKMPDALPLPVKDIPPFFEKQFVQMDFTDELPTKSNAEFVSPSDKAAEYREFVEKEFTHSKKPGWFFVASTREESAPAGGQRRTLYVGPATLAEEPPRPLVVPTGCQIFLAPPNSESVVIDDSLKGDPLGVLFVENGKEILFFVSRMQEDTPNKGQTKLHLFSIDFNSDFEPTDGSIHKIHKRRNFYFPRFRYRWPEKVWEPKGYGFGANVDVIVMSKGRSLTGGKSPGMTDASGCSYFAGRTLIFTRNAAYTKRARATLKIEGTWSAGDQASLTVGSDTVSYTVTSQDVTPPKGAVDAQFVARTRVAFGLERAIFADAAMSKHVVPRTEVAALRIEHDPAGDAGNGVPVAVKTTSKGGTLSLSSPTLINGGFTAKAKEQAINTIVHEFGHAFGFPHKCGYFTFENPAAFSCCMNYFQSWLYTLDTQNDAAKRQVMRFNEGKEGKHFCAQHTHGMRRAHLEDNPVMWTWP
jgi:outer membrane protein OmpA-like peptidoglycan-associated protein